MAAVLLSVVWVLSTVICSPPWFVSSWSLFADTASGMSPPRPFICQYSSSPQYRIYSALGSFYIPLLVGHSPALR